MTWRWRTCADPDRPHKTERISHPLADRFGEPCEIVVQAPTNGNRLIRFADGLLVVCPMWAVAA